MLGVLAAVLTLAFVATFLLLAAVTLLVGGSVIAGLICLTVGFVCARTATRLIRRP